MRPGLSSLLLLALLAVMCGSATAKLTQCRAKCLDQPWQPMCGRHTFNGETFYWVYGNPCEIACDNQADPSMPVALTQTDLKLPASCHTDWATQWGAMGPECVCGPAAAAGRGKAHRRALSA